MMLLTMRPDFEMQDKCGFRGGDTNLRRYVRNNPTNLVDPSGLQEKKATDAITRKALENLGMSPKERDAWFEAILKSGRKLTYEEVGLLLVQLESDFTENAFAKTPKKTKELSSYQLLDGVGKQWLADAIRRPVAASFVPPAVDAVTTKEVRAYHDVSARVRGLITDLDSTYRKREQATINLRKEMVDSPELVRGLFLAALGQPRSLEQRRRIETLMEELKEYHDPRPQYDSQVDVVRKQLREDHLAEPLWLSLSTFTIPVREELVLYFAQVHNGSSTL